LAVAQYRTGDFTAAITSLNKSADLDSGGTCLPDNALFLAMAHWQLGDQDEARQWYAKAVQSMTEQDSTDEELQRFRAEAEVLLGDIAEAEQLKQETNIEVEASDK
jgi:hypothetical protein